MMMMITERSRVQGCGMCMCVCLSVWISGSEFEAKIQAVSR